MTDNSPALASIQRLQNEMNRYFKERTHAVECALLGIIANEHVQVLGPPGTAKSMLARVLASQLTGALYFEIVMNKYLTWRDLACSEVLVQESTSGSVKTIRFRNVEGSLLKAHIIFFDEFWKAAPATLNSGLSLLNERTYSINPGETYKAPLLTAFVASNEAPGAGDDNLRACADRLLLTCVVDYISISHDDNSAFLEMLEDTEPLPDAPLSFEDLMYLRSEAQKIPIDRVTLGVINSIRATLKLEHRIEPSDRRYKASLKVVRANALLNGHARVEVEDLAVLEHTLWTGIERQQRDDVCKVVREVTGEAGLSLAESVFREAGEEYRESLSLTNDADAVVPFDNEQKKRRESLRNESWGHERRTGELYERLASIESGISTRRAKAMVRSLLNEVSIMRKALVHRRGVEDPFLGVGRAAV